MKTQIKETLKKNKTLTALKMASIIFYGLGVFVILASLGFFLLTYLPMLSNTDLGKGVVFIVGIAFSYVGIVGGILLLIIAVGVNIWYIQKKNKLKKAIEFTYDNPEV
jgi:hypothetical protein